MPFSQLEAIVRISESLAKLTLSPVASEVHVDEAIRLFDISTLHAVEAGPGILHLLNLWPLKRTGFQDLNSQKK
jgi:DNA replicative helicase MCM subunit Mcm2 (Cdc46/Mcm family)